jgi:hypothetical protein
MFNLNQWFIVWDIVLLLFITLTATVAVSVMKTDSATLAECAGSVITVNVSELAAKLWYLTTKETCCRHGHAQCHTSAGASWHPRPLNHGKPTYSNHLDRSRTRRSHCQSHNCQGSLTINADHPSRAPSANLCVSVPPLMETPELLCSKWTGVSLLVSEGLSAEMARDIIWWAKGKSIPQLVTLSLKRVYL